MSGFAEGFYSEAAPASYPIDGAVDVAGRVHDPERRDLTRRHVTELERGTAARTLEDPARGYSKIIRTHGATLHDSPEDITWRR